METTTTGLFARFVSRIDGGPIAVLISLGPSRNRKTGHMTQVAIVRDDVSPHEAQRTGEDFSVCGRCPLRPAMESGAICYVVTARGPLSQWKAYQRGSYRLLNFERDRHHLRGLIRVGSYGDPAAVPLSFWEKILSRSAGYTGYTHQWKCDSNQEFRKLFMASVNSAAEARVASRMGWRYFRVRRSSESLASGEVICPASIEAGQKMQCATCLRCGSRRGKNPVVYLHGSRNRQAA